MTKKSEDKRKGNFFGGKNPNNAPARRAAGMATDKDKAQAKRTRKAAAKKAASKKAAKRKK